MQAQVQKSTQLLQVPERHILYLFYYVCLFYAACRVYTKQHGGVALLCSVADGDGTATCDGHGTPCRCS